MSTGRSLSPRGDQGSDQRFLTFVMLSVAIFLFYNTFFLPRVEPPAKPDQQAAAEGEEPEAEAAGEGEAGADEDAPPVDAPAEDAPSIEALPEAETQLVSLGSAEVDGPYRMLLTLDNRGAAIRRAELSAPEFRDLDDHSGYLGELGLTDVEGGVQVNAVGPGTPAAEAGLQVGDVIVAVDRDDPLRQLAEDKRKVGNGDLSVGAFRSLVTRKKPGREVELVVRRDDEELSKSVTLSRRPLALMRPESENVRLHNPKLAADVPDAPSLVVKLTSVGKLDADSAELVAANKQLVEAAWQVVSADEKSALFRQRLPELGLEVEKRFALVATPEPERENKAFRSYHFGFDVRIKNLLPTEQSVAYQIDGPNGLPIEGWWYANRIGRNEDGNGSWGAVGLRDVIAQYQGADFIQNRCSTIVEGDAEPMGQGASMAYLGVDAQYFSVIMIPDKESPDEVWFDTAIARLATPELPEDVTRPTFNNTTFTANRKSVTLAPAGEQDAEHADAFTVFAGPKRTELLKQYQPAGAVDNNLQYIEYYGWFGPVAQAMLWLLHAFYSVVPNYGVAIIMLTIVVRGCMFPLSRKQAMNMAKMQELKPEMDRIAERYKDDMEKRGKAQQELFRKHNYNPMGGCLLMFLQLPIFIGLYRALAVDIELRQASLFGESVRFCSNLAAPDQLIDWSTLTPQWWDNGLSFGIFPGLGPYFNVLPIVTIALFLLQQKMFMPEATTEQAQLQQKMMKYMMIIFGLMFFKVPSGLCLYFIASSIWGITERKLLPKPTAPSGDAGFSKPSQSSKPKSASKPSGGEGGKNAKKKKKKRR